MENTLSSRVLVVDDDPGVLALMRRTIEGLGYKVECAGSGAEARAKLCGGSFLALVSDVSMETPDAGIRLAEESGSLCPGLSVILVSGAPSAKEMIKIAGVRTFEYLPKPFRLGDLASAVARALVPHPGDASEAGSTRLTQLGMLIRAEAWAAAERGQNVSVSVWGTPRPVSVNAEQLSRAISHLLAGAAFLSSNGRPVQAKLEFGDSEAVLTVTGDDATARSWDLEPRLAIARAMFECQGASARIMPGSFTAALPLQAAVEALR